MGQVLVRNLDDAVIARLKDQAQARGTSLEQRIRDVLAGAAAPDRAETLAALDRIRAMSPATSPDSTPLIREDRDNDEPYR